MDPVNGIFVVVMEETGGIVVLRVDLVTGEYKIEIREELLKKEGVVIKNVTVLSDNEIIIIAEKENLFVAESLKKG